FRYRRIVMSYNNRRENVVYTDGACAGNGRNGATAGYGTYWGHDNHPDNERGSVSGPQTNNRAELTAALSAADRARERGLDNLTVRTDSQLMCDSMNKYVERWRDNGYKTASGGDVKNRDLIEALDDHRSHMDLRFEYVPAHAGVRGNEAADRMARQAASEASSSRGGNYYDNNRGYQGSGYRGNGNGGSYRDDGYGGGYGRNNGNYGGNRYY
ncbi:hypothetical protein PFISCL1PPCAC_5406, partial [Pristionchus fissidentatus]